MKTVFPHRTSWFVLTIFLFVFPVIGSAQSINVPSGWNANDGGTIIKGSSKVTIGEKQELGDSSTADFITSIRNTVSNNTELLTLDKPVKDGKYVTQVTRQIKVNDVEAHSNLMICKTGINKDRLIEVYAERRSVLDLIAGAKYAIAYCAQ